MPAVPGGAKWVLVVSMLSILPFHSLAGECELSVLQGGTRYNYSLAAATAQYPHGVLSEDGFYKVAVNGSILWFQLCGNMIFNHDPPKCFGCKDCGGSLQCGMWCSALVSNDMGGYPVCSSLGWSTSQRMTLTDERYPDKGVIVKMSTSGPKACSLSVLILCDPNKFQGPSSLELVGNCDYATVLTHPSGCAKIISGSGAGGWFGTLVIVILCLLGAYFLVGAAYKFYFLHARGLEVIPNLDFWLSLPQKAQSLYGSLIQTLRGQTRGRGSSYAPIN